MIPIRFRAWDIENREMIRVDEINFGMEIVGTYIGTDERGDPGFGYLDFKQVILMQSTGLKDKNGVDIYEGDIVHWMKEFISPMDMRTKHKIDGNRKVYQKESGEWVMGQGNGLHREVENIEVIGNVYEDKELLEEEVLSEFD